MPPELCFQRTLPEERGSQAWDPSETSISSLLRLWTWALMAKLLLAAVIPLAHDEAYYWIWSHHLCWSYLDHPPFVAWLFACGHLLEQMGSAARLPAVVLGHATLLIWLAILRPHFSLGQLRWWLLLALLSPLMGLGSLVVTPDLPLVFWWSLSLLLLMSCYRSPTNAKCLALGLCVGLGFTSKYHMVLFVPCAVLAGFRTGNQAVLNVKNVSLVLVGGVIGTFPVWWWNLQNDFVSFRYQLMHGLAAEEWSWKLPVEYAGGQFLLLFPPIFLLAIRTKTGLLARSLQPFAWLPLLFFLVTSFRASVEANWPIVAYPSVFALAVMETHGVRWIRRTVAVWATAVVIVLSVVIYPWVPISPDRLKTNELYEFDELATALAGQRDVFANSYPMASQLTYKTGQPIYKLKGVGRVDFFDFVAGSQPRSRSFSLILSRDQPVPGSPSLAEYVPIDRSPVTNRYDEVRFTLRPDHGGVSERSAPE